MYISAAERHPGRPPTASPSPACACAPPHPPRSASLLPVRRSLLVLPPLPPPFAASFVSSFSRPHLVRCHCRLFLLLLPPPPTYLS
ncbi:UNVERIFIED_CONTAM: hypothetical protein Sangu_0392600, partial [Sesamum angustifolium]